MTCGQSISIGSSTTLKFSLKLSIRFKSSFEREKSKMSKFSCNLFLFDDFGIVEIKCSMFHLKIICAGVLSYFLHNCCSRLSLNFFALVNEIGRASCRERVWILVVAGSLNKKSKKTYEGTDV